MIRQAKNGCFLEEFRGLWACGLGSLSIPQKGAVALLRFCRTKAHLQVEAEHLCELSCFIKIASISRPEQWAIHIPRPATPLDGKNLSWKRSHVPA